MDHPQASDLDRLLRGQLSPAATREIVLHLLHGCPTCAATCASHFSAELLAGTPGTPSGEDYDGLFERLERPDSPLSRDLKIPASVLWAELESLAPARRLLALQHRRYRSPTFAVWLTRHSRALAQDASPSALLAAEVALSVVDQLANHTEIGQALAQDLRVSAFAHLGNARRALGSFAGGLDALHRRRESSRRETRTVSSV
jgi:hypothetical protein